MNVIRFCIDRPVTVTVCVLLVVIFGTLSVVLIPVQLTPTVDNPVVSVQTAWPGANPQEVEREIVDRQEEMLRSVRGLRRMTSVSADNQAQITLEMHPEIDRNEALRDVSEKLRQVTGYPAEVEEPTIAAADAEIDTIIAWLILYGREDDGEVLKLRDFAEEFIQPYLDRVPGVASTSLYGGLEREMQVRVDAGRLAARGLTLRDVERALRQQNLNVSAGTRALGKRDYAIRTVGQYQTAEEIRDTIVSGTPGGPVYVRDVADVELGFREPTGFVRSQGQYVLGIPVRREVGANVIQVMAGVRNAIAAVNEEVLKARGMDLELVQVYDETVYISQAIEMVRSNIVYGSALVLGLLLAFLRSWRATAVLALTIPVSVVGTFLVIVALGRTLNVISLAGIAFAVGDVVDSAYVVLENVFRHKQMGKEVRRAVLEGTREVWAPVLVSTLTTLAVFVPVVFMQEEAGQLFRDISIAEVAAVSLSMLVAVTVIPPLAARLLKRDVTVRRYDDTQRNAKEDIVLRFAGWIAAAGDRVNGTPLARPALVALMTFGSLFLARFFIPETTYLPAGNRNLVFGFLLTPPGYSVDEFRRMAGVIEHTVRPYWEAVEGSPEHRALDQSWREQIERQLAANAIPEVNNPELTALERSRARREWLTPPPLIENFFFVVWNGGCFMGCDSRDPARVKPLVRLLQTAGGQIPGTFPVFFQSQIFTFGGGNTAEVQIRGDDLEAVTRAAGAMMMACMSRYGFPRPDPANFNLGRPELRVTPDRERAIELGLTAHDIGFLVEACGDGAYVGDFRPRGGDTIDIRLFIRGQRDRPMRDLADVPLYTSTGRVVTLREVARLEETTALEQIKHIERQRAVSLEVTPPEAMPLSTVIRQIRDEIEPELRRDGRIDPSVAVSFTGNADKLVQAREALVGKWEGWTAATLMNLLQGRFFLSVLIVYLLMCALYESWLYPCVIMFSVPPAILGGFLGLSVAHWATLTTTHQPVQQLDVLTFLGFVMLVGLVVKNAILLVEQTLVHLREHGMDERSAIRQAVRVRVRPVLMTTLTSIFGLLPLAILPGAGSELYRGLAAVLLGGMFVATIGTLIVVPAAMSLCVELRRRLWGPVRGGAAVAPQAAPHDR